MPKGAKVTDVPHFLARHSAKMSACLSAFAPTTSKYAFTHRPRTMRRRHVCAAASLPTLPLSTKEQIAQAAEAVSLALVDGKPLQSIEMNLPLIGATDLDDWPGGVAQQYLALAPMVNEVMKTLNSSEENVKQRGIEEGDAVYALTLANDVVVTFPTAEVLGDLRDIEKQTYRLKIIANPQWNTTGGSNIISDFGIGPWKKRAEDFIQQFEVTYYLREQRIQGEIIRTLKVYPHPWQVFALAPNAQNKIVAEPLGTFDERPMYDELKKILESREGSIAAMNWVERAKREATFNAKSLEAPPRQE